MVVPSDAQPSDLIEFAVSRKDLPHEPPMTRACAEMAQPATPAGEPHFRRESGAEMQPRIPFSVDDAEPLSDGDVAGDGDSDNVGGGGESDDAPAPSPTRAADSPARSVDSPALMKRSSSIGLIFARVRSAASLPGLKRIGSRVAFRRSGPRPPAAVK